MSLEIAPYKVQAKGQTYSVMRRKIPTNVSCFTIFSIKMLYSSWIPLLDTNP
jgi:hypothetical protein